MTWVLHRAGICYLTHYLDDLLFLMPPQEGDGSSILCLARSLFATLDVPVVEHKTEGPSSVITFLGIAIDTAAGELCLPNDIPERFQELISRWSEEGMYQEKN